MKSIEIDKKTMTLIKEIRSIKKPKEINPLLEKIVKLFEDQLYGLDIRITQLKEENKRLNRL